MPVHSNWLKLPTATRTMMLGGLILIGLAAPALLGLDVFQHSLLGYFTLTEALGMSVSLSFIFFSSTLLYVVLLGNEAITSDRECLAVALAVTVVSFGIDLAYCYIGGLSLGDFVTALVALYTFFLGCFVLTRVRELIR